MAINYSSLPESAFASLAQEIGRHTGLNQVFEWAATKPRDHFNPFIVAEVVTQDEFTHDVIVPYKNIFLVYDTT